MLTDERLLTEGEILAAPSGQVVLHTDGTVNVRASRINRELEIARAQLAKDVAWEKEHK